MARTLQAGSLESDLFTPPRDRNIVRVPAITICQPYTALVCGGSKRTENRTWSAPFRGRILIHAGKSRQWLETADETDLAELAGKPLIFGAAICAATVLDCIAWPTVSPSLAMRYSWLHKHRHAHGPYCMVLDDIQPLHEPLPMRGGQKIFPAELPRDFAIRLGFSPR